MLSFGLVGEGPTDHTIVKNIVAAYFGRRTPMPSLQPEPGAPGGWPRVFTWLQEGRYREALEEYHYLILHLDTDESPRYGVPHLDAQGNKLAPAALVALVVERLVTAIGEDFYAAHKDRFIFAIAVHEVECWILVLHDDHHRHDDRIKNCLSLANRELDRKRMPLLNKGGRGPRVSEPYHRASFDFANLNRLLAVRDRNPSLALFVRRLEALAASPPPEPAPPA
jgi:hypothetical protein